MTEQATRSGARNIALIGMAGVGKSFLGRRLARRLGWRFADIDEMMEAAVGMPLQQLADQEGEAAFLALEEKTIVAMIALDGWVIAPGGSAVYSAAAMNHLRSVAHVVYLYDDPARIIARIDNLPTRAVMGLKGVTLEELWRRRDPLYRKYAHVTLDLGTMASAEEAVGQMAAMVGRAGDQ